MTKRKLSGYDLENKRIQVWWPPYKKYYTCLVLKYHERSRKHKVKYEDDDEENLDLTKEKVRMVVDEAGDDEVEELEGTEQSGRENDGGKEVSEMSSGRKKMEAGDEENVPYMRLLSLRSVRKDESRGLPSGSPKRVRRPDSALETLEESRGKRTKSPQSNPVPQANGVDGRDGGTRKNGPAKGVVEVPADQTISINTLIAQTEFLSGIKMVQTEVRMLREQLFLLQQENSIQRAEILHLRAEITEGFRPMGRSANQQGTVAQWSGAPTKLDPWNVGNRANGQSDETGANANSVDGSEPPSVSLARSQGPPTTRLAGAESNQVAAATGPGVVPPVLSSSAATASNAPMAPLSSNVPPSATAAVGQSRSRPSAGVSAQQPSKDAPVAAPPGGAPGPFSGGKATSASTNATPPPSAASKGGFGSVAASAPPKNSIAPLPKVSNLPPSASLGGAPRGLAPPKEKPPNKDESQVSPMPSSSLQTMVEQPAKIGEGTGKPAGGFSSTGAQFGTKKQSSGTSKNGLSSDHNLHSNSMENFRTKNPPKPKKPIPPSAPGPPSTATAPGPPSAATAPGPPSSASAPGPPSTATAPGPPSTATAPGPPNASKAPGQEWIGKETPSDNPGGKNMAFAPKAVISTGILPPSACDGSNVDTSKQGNPKSENKTDSGTLSQTAQGNVQTRTALQHADYFFDSYDHAMDMNGSSTFDPVAALDRVPTTIVEFVEKARLLVAITTSIWIVENASEASSNDLTEWALSVGRNCMSDVCSILKTFKNIDEAVHLFRSKVEKDVNQLEWLLYPSRDVGFTKARSNYAVWQPPVSETEWAQEKVLLRGIQLRFFRGIRSHGSQHKEYVLSNLDPLTSPLQIGSRIAEYGAQAMLAEPDLAKIQWFETKAKDGKRNSFGSTTPKTISTDAKT